MGKLVYTPFIVIVKKNDKGRVERGEREIERESVCVLQFLRYRPRYK